MCGLKAINQGAGPNRCAGISPQGCADAHWSAKWPRGRCHVSAVKTAAYRHEAGLYCRRLWSFGRYPNPVFGSNIEAVPVHGVLYGEIFGVNKAARIVKGYRPLLAQCERNILQPKLAVEGEIEQSAVHIKQHSINGIPVEFRGHADSITPLCGMTLPCAESGN